MEAFIKSWIDEVTFADEGVLKLNPREGVVFHSAVLFHGR